MATTQTPWSYEISPEKTQSIIVDDDGCTIAMIWATRNSTAHTQLETTTAHIVKCVNAHNGLVNALIGLLLLRNESGTDGTYTPQGAEARRILNELEKSK